MSPSDQRDDIAARHTGAANPTPSGLEASGAVGHDEYAVDPERVRSLKERARVALRRTISARPAYFNAHVKDLVPKLAALWNLSAEEVAGLMGEIRPDRDLTEDQFLRASALVGIYKALHVWFSMPLANDWPKLPNTGPTFRGRRPLDVMIEGGTDKILETRLHLDQHRPWTVEEIEKVWGIKIELPVRRDESSDEQGG